MTTLTVSTLTALILVAAVLYSSVGHAGASGYLAAMALLGIAPAVMKPTALVLNVLVATIATIKFYRAGCFSWSIFWPFVITSIPFSFIGGMISLPGYLYEPIVGLVLLYAAYRLWRVNPARATTEIKPVSRGPALLCGAGIGLLAGLTGTGGGIFLSPLLLFMGWAEARQTAGVSAAFILANSVAGLMGNLSSTPHLPAAIPVWAVAAVTGGYVGAEHGSKRLSNSTLRRVLAVVLVIASLKMIFA